MGLFDKFFNRDNEVVEEIEFDWSKPDESIRKFKTMLLDRAYEEQIWYEEARNMHGIWSKILKFTSVLLVGFGTLWPLINNLLPKDTASISWGYLSLSIGGIIMLFDKHFSLSSGFQRFYVAEMDIIRLTEAFIIDWESGVYSYTKSSQKDLSGLFKIAKAFDADVSKVVSNETKNWSVEFEKHFEELQKNLKK